MELEKLEATIEAVLFAMGNAVSVEKIATAIGHDTETTRKLVHQMMDRYNQREGRQNHTCRVAADARYGNQ